MPVTDSHEPCVKALELQSPVLRMSGEGLPTRRKTTHSTKVRRFALLPHSCPTNRQETELPSAVFVPGTLAK